jgi:hypothetical protein
MIKLDIKEGNKLETPSSYPLDLAQRAPPKNSDYPYINNLSRSIA